MVGVIVVLIGVAVLICTVIWEGYKYYVTAGNGRPEIKERNKCKEEILMFVKQDREEMKNHFAYYEKLSASNHLDFAPKAPTMYKGVINGSIGDQVAQINNKMSMQKYDKDMEEYDKWFKDGGMVSYYIARKKLLDSEENEMKKIIQRYQESSNCLKIFDKYIKLVRK